MGVKPFPRQGAFCTMGKKVGIIFEYPQQNATEEGGVVTLDASSAEVHFMDAKGETESRSRNVPIGSLEQARLAQIPAKRRPSEAAAKRYGYK